VCQWKKFENRSIIGEDMDKSKVPRFLAYPVHACLIGGPTSGDADASMSVSRVIVFCLPSEGRRLWIWFYLCLYVCSCSGWITQKIGTHFEDFFVEGAACMATFHRLRCRDAIRLWYVRVGALFLTSLQLLWAAIVREKNRSSINIS